MHKTITDPIAENDSSDAEYVKDLAVRIFSWLSTRCVQEGIKEFKMNDVKRQFKTISSVFLESSITILVEEGKVMTPEGHSPRIIVYSVDVDQALLVVPPLP